jgi:hypothetical protein
VPPRVTLFARRGRRAGARCSVCEKSERCEICPLDAHPKSLTRWMTPSPSSLTLDAAPPAARMAGIVPAPRCVGWGAKVMANRSVAPDLRRVHSRRVLRVAMRVHDLQTGQIHPRPKNADHKKQHFNEDRRRPGSPITKNPWGRPPEPHFGATASSVVRCRPSLSGGAWSNVRQSPLSDADNRPGCYISCYTISQKT